MKPHYQQNDRLQLIKVYQRGEVALSLNERQQGGLQLDSIHLQCLAIIVPAHYCEKERKNQTKKRVKARHTCSKRDRVGILYVLRRKMECEPNSFRFGRFDSHHS